VFCHGCGLPPHKVWEGRLSRRASNCALLKRCSKVSKARLNCALLKRASHLLACHRDVCLIVLALHGRRRGAAAAGLRVADRHAVAAAAPSTRASLSVLMMGLALARLARRTHSWPLLVAENCGSFWLAGRALPRLPWGMDWLSRKGNYIDRLVDRTDPCAFGTAQVCLALLAARVPGGDRQTDR
jgi:hypothetical protein